MKNHEDTNDTKTHEDAFVQSVIRDSVVIFAPSWFLLCS